MNDGLDLRSPEFIASHHRPGKRLSLFLLILLGLFITICSYGALSFYAQSLRQQKDTALFELHNLQDKAEQLQELESETVLLQRKADLEKELSASNQPLSEWLLLTRETASAGGITLREVSLDRKGSFSIEGESLMMQQIAAFERQLAALAFLSEVKINGIAMKSEQGYHFTISGLLYCPKGESVHD